MSFIFEFVLLVFSFSVLTSILLFVLAMVWYVY